ncbi:MAG: threonine synthase [Lachnospiraceae bacterium]|nr:threonine synthase [Lachnospiraceae bacterium]MCI1328963.1 threonine synthase [Lachnospiraceae bacterium]
MNSLYHSTRGGDQKTTASRAILAGLASDGGLYVPDSIPSFDLPLTALADMDYRAVAFEVMSRFLTDYTEEELRDCIDHAYDDKFDTKEIAHLHEAGDAFYLELFHGKTIAFKDMALSILPYLMTTAAKKNNIREKIVILTATSGDTGKAAMAGFADVPGTEIIVFYPKDGVSPVQERMMVTQKGDNTHVVAIRGNFDDAQTGVKKIFGDGKMAADLRKAGCRFSSANSINIGRLVPQIAYYFYAYANLLKRGKIQAGDPVNVTVPTGNFGNILAAHYAKKMGLPVGRLICASNSNNVLTDFFRTGVYDRNRDFFLTSSPSMDILVSSNLERLICESAGGDVKTTAALMKSLRETGKYEITDAMRRNMDDFYGGYADEDQVFEEIRRVYRESHYVIDPHTAVASAVYHNYVKETGDGTVTVIASTASPYKFARNVLAALDPKYGNFSDDEQFDALAEVSGVAIPAAIRELRAAKVRHNTVVDIAGMEQSVREILHL